MRTRVKICGITNLQDAEKAIALGADALGFVFYKPSPRYVDPNVAAQIIQQLPPFVTIVGLFVNSDKSEVAEIIANVHLDLLQFHGDESESECVSYNKPYIKAVRVKTQAMILQAFEQYSSARALLLDAYKPGVPGGTGETFDWDLIPDKNQCPGSIILAGGLNVENIASAIKAVLPFAVDVSGGVELSKGVKDHSKIEKFIGEVSSVDRNENN